MVETQGVGVHVRMVMEWGPHRFALLGGQRSRGGLCPEQLRGGLGLMEYCPGTLVASVGIWGLAKGQGRGGTRS